MKALILAAGLGTRLRPFSQKLPKPLFPIAGQPLLDIIIESLQQAGCSAIMINTHHLHQQLESFVASRQYAIPVHTRHEPAILGTGGAVKNVSDFWDDAPFIVVNSDILTDIDFRAAYDFHSNHDASVTMVLYDDPAFNTVAVDGDDFVTEIYDSVDVAKSQDLDSGIEKKHNARKIALNQIRKLAFTGIQIVDPEILGLIPENTFFNSIDAYRNLIPQRKLKAYIPRNRYWKDIGTPQRYSQAVCKKMAPQAFRKAFSAPHDADIVRIALHGDGSDRKWSRLTQGKQSLILVDHGIRLDEKTNETDAFVFIGRHLYNNGIRVPEIYLYDRFSGLVFMEDLGDTHLQSVIQRMENQEKRLASYQAVIDLMIELSLNGARDFDDAWTYQTSHYDRRLILDRECRYFVTAFVNGYLGLDLNFEDFKKDFLCLADQALKYSVIGLMHRDMQSRNIMVKNNQYYFIDFQGARLGPIQYDLAALLIDPYVDLDRQEQDLLRRYCAARLSALISLDPELFYRGYKYCAITRNLQILGAFGHLSRVKGKTYFEKYIPTAVTSLKQNLSVLDQTELYGFKTWVEKL